MRLHTPNRPELGAHYSIPEWAWPAAEKPIEDANHRLERAGIDERFTYECGQEYPVKQDDGSLFMYRKPELSRAAIGQDGWSFTAAVERTEKDAIVKSRPGV